MKFLKNWIFIPLIMLIVLLYAFKVKVDSGRCNNMCVENSVITQCRYSVPWFSRAGYSGSQCYYSTNVPGVPYGKRHTGPLEKPFIPLNIFCPKTWFI